ncbi:hypothetical protein OF846_003145 [Rhodotorula toruloides]|nr:hypothetical protein OF846_003145 [Rhodotorula toruloides]
MWGGEMEGNRGFRAFQERAECKLANLKRHRDARLFSSDAQRARSSWCETKQRTKKTMRNFPATTSPFASGRLQSPQHRHLNGPRDAVCGYKTGRRGPAAVSYGMAPQYAYIAAIPPLLAYDPTFSTPILASATSFLVSRRSLPSVDHVVAFQAVCSRLTSRSAAKYRPSFLERRRQRLAFFLATILLHPILGGDPIVRQWVLE